MILEAVTWFDIPRTQTVSCIVEPVVFLPGLSFDPHQLHPKPGRLFKSDFKPFFGSSNAKPECEKSKLGP